MKPHLVYQTSCPGCGKHLHGPSEEKRRAAVVRHIRNCNALNFGRVAPPLVPLSEALSRPPGGAGQEDALLGGESLRAPASSVEPPALPNTGTDG